MSQIYSYPLRGARRRTETLQFGGVYQSKPLSRRAYDTDAVMLNQSAQDILLNLSAVFNLPATAKSTNHTIQSKIPHEYCWRSIVWRTIKQWGMDGNGEFGVEEGRGRRRNVGKGDFSCKKDRQDPHRVPHFSQHFESPEIVKLWLWYCEIFKNKMFMTYTHNYTHFHTLSYIHIITHIT